VKFLRKRYCHQFITSSWFCLTSFLILFISSAARGWSGAQEQWWLLFQVLTDYSCSPFWQERASPIEGHNADPAWFLKIGFQAKTSPRCCCLLSSDQGDEEDYQESLEGASNINQVQIIPLELVFCTDILWLNCSFLVCRPISWTLPARKSRRAKKIRSWELQRIQRRQSIPWSNSRNRSWKLRRILQQQLILWSISKICMSQLSPPRLSILPKKRYVISHLHLPSPVPYWFSAFFSGLKPLEAALVGPYIR
jgi:hypothetical protein